MAEVFGPGSSLKGICALAGSARRSDDEERTSLDGPVRVPGQAVLRPLRHPGAARAAWPTPSTRRSPQADAAGYPVVVKAQVQVGGRGKAGGIKLANDADEVRLHAGNILGMDIKGHVVKRVWVEHACDIAEEYYASFTLDRAAKKHLLMLSAPRAASRSRRWPQTNPDAIVMLPHRPGRRARRSTTPARPCVDAKLDPSGRRRRRRHPRQAVPLLHRGRLRPGRDQPADPATRRRRARPRRQGQPRQQRRVPPSRVGRVPGDRGARRARAAGPRHTTCSTSASTAPSASSPTAPAWR